MKLTLNWLREYVDFDDPVEKLADRLTFAGLEVESIDPIDALTPSDPPDAVLELEITPNRPDCLSLIGIAREVAALTGNPLKLPDAVPPVAADPSTFPIQIELRDPVCCPRYTARVFEIPPPKPSPEWMRHRLEACGIRSINMVVDITNYVLLETGHPLHAFDLRQIEGEQIIVRRAHPGERITTLDGDDHELSADMLVIADAKKAVALAGIMGGANSEICDSTSTILLESAMFEPSGIRATAKALGLHTDSSYRFQRGVNSDTVDWASRRAAALLCTLAGAVPVQGVADVYPEPKQRRRVVLDRDRARDLIGLPVADDEMDRVLRSLDLLPVESDERHVAVEIPTFRDDLTRDVDLIEEVARLYGVDRIPEKTPAAELVPGAHDDDWRALRTCRTHLVGLGAREIMNYTLVNHHLLDLFNPQDCGQREELPHPISAEQSVLRTSLIPQMVESLGRNRSRQVQTAVFFEIGRTFVKGQDGPVQKEAVCIGMMGSAGRRDLDLQRDGSDEESLLWIKGLVEQLLRTRRIQADFQVAEQAPAFARGKALAVCVDGRPIGLVGLVADKPRKEWRLHDPVAVAELDLAPLLAGGPPRSEISDIPLYPSVERDIALTVDEAIRHQDILDAMRDAAPAELEEIRLFDVFRGKALGQGKKSMAYRLIYRSGNRTLTDEEANRFHDAVTKQVCLRTGAALRDQ